MTKIETLRNLIQEHHRARGALGDGRAPTMAACVADTDARDALVEFLIGAENAAAHLLIVAEKAQAVVTRWDTPLWKDVPATAIYINELRRAIEGMGE